MRTQSTTITIIHTIMAGPKPTITKPFPQKAKMEETQNIHPANQTHFDDMLLEMTTQKALNKNMLALISAMGVFVILSKIIDKF